MKECLVKDLIEEINDYIDNIEDCSFEELLNKQCLVVVRSIKETDFENFLQKMSLYNYTGTLYIIGRSSDNGMIKKYKNINTILFAVSDEEMYSENNTKEYLELFRTKEIDGSLLFVQNKITKRYNNVLNIVKHIKGEHYVLRSDMTLMKLSDAHRYLTGINLYDDLCQWYGE